MRNIKSPNVAGAFYSSDPDELGAEVDRYIAAAEKKLPKIDGAVRAVIAPHAGYLYSGPVAGYSFAALKQSILKSKVKKPVIVVIAPSHYYPFDGAATASFEAFETPLGNVRSKNLFSDLHGCQVIVDLPDVFEQEHALEVELPFLQRALKGIDFEIRPILAGSADPRRLADELLPLASRPDVFWVISSDLSHFHPESHARPLDLDFCKSVEAMDLKKMEEGEACGDIGIKTIVRVAKKAGWKAQFLHYDNSSTTSGDFSRVVGYGAFAFLN